MKFSYILFGLVLTSCSMQTAKSEKKVIQNTIVQQQAKPVIPESIIFCGDTIDFTDFDAKERLDQELIVNTYFHSSTILALKRTARYFPEIERILKEEGLPDDLKYLCLIESNLIPTITSPTGARGLWQFMPETAKEYNLKINTYVDERLDPEKSTRAACQYLKSAYAEFHDWSLAAASYNRGMGGMRNDVETQYGDNYFDLHLNHETGRYIFRLLAMKLILENPGSYGFNLDDKELYKPVPSKSIEVTTSISDLAKWAKEHGTSYRKVRLLNPWILGNQLKLNQDTLSICLPSNK